MRRRTISWRRKGLVKISSPWRWYEVEKDTVSNSEDKVYYLISATCYLCVEGDKIRADNGQWKDFISFCPIPGIFPLVQHLRRSFSIVASDVIGCSLTSLIQMITWSFASITSSIIWTSLVVPSRRSSNQSDHDERSRRKSTCNWMETRSWWRDPKKHISENILELGNGVAGNSILSVLISYFIFYIRELCRGLTENTILSLLISKDILFHLSLSSIFIFSKEFPVNYLKS